ncbi:MAG TPA: hypothetical protein VHC67_02570, partial [Gaiellaceae bacterium]|nr:hypothetical protein [Gaiellaceae bacterium]
GKRAAVERLSRPVGHGPGTSAAGAAPGSSGAAAPPAVAALAGGTAVALPRTTEPFPAGPLTRGGRTPLLVLERPD